MATVLRAEVGGLYLHALWHGAALLEVHEIRFGEYEIVATAFDVGEYSLEVTVMWENHSMAMSPNVGETPHILRFESDLKWRNQRFPHARPLCRPLLRSLPERVDDLPGSPWVRERRDAVRIRIYGGPSLPKPTRPCEPFGSARFNAGERADSGRWRLVDANDECSLRWQPFTCLLTIYNGPSVEACIAKGIRVAFQGDSHMRELWGVLLEATSGRVSSS